jgi:hypothetical protein
MIKPTRRSRPELRRGYATTGRERRDPAMHSRPSRSGFMKLRCGHLPCGGGFASR